jgi:hypothetical protein
MTHTVESLLRLAYQYARDVYEYDPAQLVVLESALRQAFAQQYNRGVEAAQDTYIQSNSDTILGDAILALKEKEE